MEEPPAPGAVLRPTSRVLLMDARDEVLLFLMSSDDGQVFWCPPGGGVDTGETHEQAAVRELAEETGWADPDLGPQIGFRRHVVAWSGITYDCRERWFVARVGALDVDDAGWTDEERVDMVDHRWWSVAALRASTERLVPADLADVLARLLRDGAPAEPWALGS